MPKASPKAKHSRQDRLQGDTQSDGQLVWNLKIQGRAPAFLFVLKLQTVRKPKT